MLYSAARAAILRRKIVSVVGTYGLIDFGEGNSSRYYSIPHDATLDLGSGAWAWFWWQKVGENTGTAYQYILSSGVQPDIPSFVVYLGEGTADIVGEQNRMVMRIVDNAGVNTAADISSTAPGADGVERLVVVQSTGTTLEMWFCPKGGTATRVINEATNLGALTAPVDWNFGRRTDGEAARYFEEEAGGLGKANAALSQANIEAIAAPASPVSVLGANCVAYWPFLAGAAATVVDVVSGITATRQGSGWPSVPGGVVWTLASTGQTAQKPISAGNTLTFNKPGNLANNDLIGVVIATHASGDNLTGVPTGFTALQDTTAPGAWSSAFAYKRITNAAGEPATWDFTMGSGRGMAAVLGHWRGGSAPTFDVRVDNNATTSTSHVCPDATAAANDSLAIRAIGSDKGSTYTSPIEEVGDVSSSDDETSAWMGWQQVNSGPVGTVNVTRSFAEESTRWTIVFRPTAS